MTDTAGGTLDAAEALQQVVQKARRHRHLSRGLNECARSLEQRRAVLCILSNNLTEENYLKLIQALCQEHQIPLMKVDNSELLGTWAGLAKYDEEGNPSRIVKCGCVVIQQWDGSDEASSAVQSLIKSNLN